MSKLVCKDFSVQYFGYDAAINNVSTTFSDGINVIFAGEKGGKTTFLKALAGIIPHQGELFLDDINVDELSLRERDFQMLFDDYALFSRHSVRYNLEYPLKLRKVPKAQRRALVEEVCALFDLDIMLDAPVYRLNEWLKVTLVLCRAYLRKAKVLLIDNIFSKLSYSERMQAFRRFMPLFREGIVIYATDSKEEAAALSQDIKHLSCGFLVQEGSERALRERPLALSVFTAWEEYPTIMPCTVCEKGVIVQDTLIEMPLRGKLAAYLGKEAVVALSPKDFAVSDKGFTATVVGKFYNGERIVYSALADDTTFYFESEKELLTSSVVLSVKSVVGVFDALNERLLTEV